MTQESSIDKRHVSAESFDLYLESRVPVILPIQGNPEVFIFVEPAKSELGLRVRTGSDSETPETGLRNVVTRSASRDGLANLEVVVTASTLFRDAYPVLCSMADRIQIGGLSPAQALRATLDKMSSLLQAPDSMSREHEVGLFGELLFLGGLINALGAKDAVRAWRGGQAEEHDFGLPSLDVEVKTTTGERRSHWIESLTQLVPTRHRPLWLVSTQLTTAGTGHGRTLAALVETVRTRLDSDADRAGFELALTDSGWREDGGARLVTRWTPRTESTAFRVAGAFPRLCPEALRENGVPLDRIPDVRYRVDLEGLENPDEMPDLLATAILFEGQI
ncbi:PD-(D/E)XK motif protein [Prauserella flavalba]|uniref:PD-(D/E)XK motif protein n=1 Tax=Prauserella flavalba TaxID=1477506 RepID=UPI0036E21D93